MTDLLVHGRIEPRHIDGVVEIDKFRFGKEPSPTQFDWAEQFPWAYSVLTQGGLVAGYSLVLPVDNFGAEALKRGEMEEEELTRRFIRPLDACDALYLASVAARPEAESHIRKQLVGITQGQLLRPRVEMFAIAISKAGDSIAKELQMTPKLYDGPFTGLGDYKPKLFVQKPFVFQ